MAVELNIPSGRGAHAQLARDLRLATLRTQGMEKTCRMAPLLIALLCLVAVPGPAIAGYDIAHIVERTCDPGGALIVTDKWKASKDQGEMITEPGEVVGCPPAGPGDAFQIAAGPEGIGRESYLCTYVSLFNGDGADVCSATDSVGGEKALVQPMVVVLPEESGRLMLIGTISDKIATVELAPPGSGSEEATVIPIDLDQATRLGAPRAFGYFSLPITRPTLCADNRPRVLGRDSSGRRIAESRVPRSSWLLSAADRVPHATSLRELCGPSPPEETMTSAWLTKMGAVFRSLYKALGLV